MKFLKFVLFFFQKNFSIDFKKIIDNKIEYFKKNPKKSIFFSLTILMQIENLIQRKCTFEGTCNIVCPTGMIYRIPFINNIFFINSYFIKQLKYEIPIFEISLFKDLSKFDIFCLNCPIYGNYYLIKKTKEYFVKKNEEN